MTASGKCLKYSNLGSCGVNSLPGPMNCRLSKEEVIHSHSNYFQGLPHSYSNYF